MTLVLVLVAPLSIATDISEDTEWTDGGTISGDYVVKSGSTLTISGAHDVETDASITVEDGANLVVNGDLIPPQASILEVASQASVVVPVGMLGPSGTVRIIFDNALVYNTSIEINGVTTDDFTGDEFNWNGNLDVDNVTFNFSHLDFEYVLISQVQIAPQDSTPVVRTAEELSGAGTTITYPFQGHQWSIDVQGSMTVTGKIQGAQINCSGTCSLNGAEMVATGPIDVTGTLSVTSSSLAGSITDEDVMVWDDAVISWDNQSSGTGGIVDNWVRVLTTRTVGVQNGYVMLFVENLGYNARNTSAMWDNSSFDVSTHGDNVIEIGTHEHEKMVEWQDGNGDVYTEQASARLVLATPWGTYEKVIENLPQVNHFDANIDLPKLELVSVVASDDENSANSRLGVMTLVTNTGNAPATFLVDCMSNGTDANVGVNVPYTIEANQADLEIPMNWDSANEGVFTLDCEIFVPYHFDGIDVGGGQTVSTEEVTWNPADEDGGVNLIIPIAIGVVIAAIIFTLITINNRLVEKAVVTNESETEDEEPEKEYLDDDEDITTIE